MDNQDLRFIKKHYGERFAKLCRKWFSGILEHPGVLSNIISSHFDEVPTLYDDVLLQEDEFVSFVLDLAEEQLKGFSDFQATNESPEELLSKAGYILYPECKTDEDIQKFRKYYTEDEELCTFYSFRLNICRVWFAVKTNVDQIKREQFLTPQRQDEYGTSVISIQFTKGDRNILSIKNRYNHTVKNPDATFSNNLDNIIPGLTDAFIKKFGINYYLATNDKHFNLKNYILAKNGKYYKIVPYCDMDDYTICENNIIVLNRTLEPKRFDKDRFLILDNILIGLEKHKFIRELDIRQRISTRSSSVSHIGEIKDITVHYTNDKNKVVTIIPEVGDKITIVANKSNSIIEYYDSNIKTIGNNFLYKSRNLKKIELPNVESIGDYFLFFNSCLETLSLPNVKEVGFGFLASNESLLSIDMQNLEHIGNFAFAYVSTLGTLDLPNLKTVGNDFMRYGKLTTVNLPKVHSVGNDFLVYDYCLKNVNMPKIKNVGEHFLEALSTEAQLNVPNLRRINFKDKIDCYRLKKIEEIYKLNKKSKNKDYLL